MRLSGKLGLVIPNIQQDCFGRNVLFSTQYMYGCDSVIILDIAVLKCPNDANDVLIAIQLHKRDSTRHIRSLKRKGRSADSLNVTECPESYKTDNHLRFVWHFCFSILHHWKLQQISYSRPSDYGDGTTEHEFDALHYIDVIMTTMASQITSLTVVYSTVYSDADQRKHQSSASIAFVWGIHRDRWIPRTNGQLRGNCFHLMTSSCCLMEFLRITSTPYAVLPLFATRFAAGTGAFG